MWQADFGRAQPGKLLTKTDRLIHEAAAPAVESKLHDPGPALPRCGP